MCIPFMSIFYSIFVVMNVHNEIQTYLMVLDLRKVEKRLIIRTVKHISFIFFDNQVAIPFMNTVR